MISSPPTVTHKAYADQVGIAAAIDAVVSDNIEAEPNLEAIYLFPSDEEIRLIEVDPLAPSEDNIAPFYFPPDPIGGIPYRTAIALITPEMRRLAPPREWGTWESATQVWPRKTP